MNSYAVRLRAGCGSPVAFCGVGNAGRRSVAWTTKGSKLLEADEVLADVVHGGT